MLLWYICRSDSNNLSHSSLICTVMWRHKIFKEQNQIFVNPVWVTTTCFNFSKDDLFQLTCIIGNILNLNKNLTGNNVLQVLVMTWHNTGSRSLPELKNDSFPRKIDWVNIRSRVFPWTKDCSLWFYNVVFNRKYKGHAMKKLMKMSAVHYHYCTNTFKAHFWVIVECTIGHQ